MVAALSLFASALLFLPTVTLGAPTDLARLRLPIDNHLWCKLPIANKFFCPRGPATSALVKTLLGTAKGALNADGVARFPVKYASAARWKESVLATTWQLPNGSTNVTDTPLACPQPNADSADVSEDCLSMVIFVPPLLTSSSGVPVLTWIHGGSFIVGSATSAELDGSNLALATGSIVAVIQYRLGALGFMAPSGQTNLAIKDVINALKFLKATVPALGGSASKITLAGQSSGANMIRALLATPSASSLFKSAILQSDPMNSGFLTPAIQTQMQTYYNDAIGCSATDTACHDALSVDTIVNSEMDLFFSAIFFAPGAGNSQAIRPVRDGSLITTPLDSTAPFPPVSKPLLITTVKDEGTAAIFANNRDAMLKSDFTDACDASFGPDRTQLIMDAEFYSMPADISDTRPELALLATDYIWKCPSWTFARNWAQNGGTAYVGLYTLGATYPQNAWISPCADGGVCHQDDIEIVFGTVPSPTTAQASLTAQIQTRYKAFLTNGNPNVPALPTWTVAGTSDVHPLNLGGSSPIPVGACDPSFWGALVQYDYQFYGL